MRAGEVFFDERRAQANGVENLRAAIRLIGRDAHLRHDLEHGLAERFDEALLDIGGGVLSPQFGQHLIERFEREVRIDRLGAVTGQRAELVHLVRLAGFDDETDRGSQALFDQMMMDRRCRQQRWNCDPVLAHGAVGEDDDVAFARAHEFFGLGADAIECRPHAALALIGGVSDVDRDRGEVVVPDLANAANAFQIFVGQNRLIDFETLLLGRAFEIEKVRARSDERNKAHHQFFADAIDRRIGDLCEVLLEIGVQQLRLRRQRRDRRIVTHRADRFLAELRHRRHQELQAFLRVAERLLQIQQRHVGFWHRLFWRQRQL